MATITVNGQRGNFAEDKRLVLAIKEAGVNIGHRCGGQARCTTCRVKFVSGTPDTMTKAEYEKLVQRDLLGDYRLSCQIVCTHDMEVEAIMTLESEGWSDTGPELDEEVVPAAEWFPTSEL